MEWWCSKKANAAKAIPIFGRTEGADVTGAGDTVIAVFTLALAAGATFDEAAVLANYAGGIVVMKRGTATVSRAELARRLAQAKPLAARRQTIDRHARKNSRSSKL